MSLSHAILGLLRDEPMSGYDLKTKCFDKTIAHFWPADQAQIYRTLDRMAERGWVTFEEEEQENRPNRKVYRLTEEGHGELDRWITEERFDLTKTRDPTLIQIFHAGEHDPSVVREVLEHRREVLEARLATFEAIPLPELEAEDAPWHTVLQRMTLEMGLASTRCLIEATNRCLARVEAEIDARSHS